MRVTVSVAGVRPSGRVVVLRGGKTIAAGRLTAAGKAAIRLPKQRQGARRLTVRYVGDANVAGSSHDGHDPGGQAPLTCDPQGSQSLGRLGTLSWFAYSHRVIDEGRVR